MAVWSKIGYPKGFLPIQIYKTICFFHCLPLNFLRWAEIPAVRQLNPNLKKVESLQAQQWGWPDTFREKPTINNGLQYVNPPHFRTILVAARIFEKTQWLRVLRGIRNALLLTVLEDDALVQELNMYCTSQNSGYVGGLGLYRAMIQ